MKLKKLLAMLLSVATAFTCFAAIGCGGNEGGGNKGNGGNNGGGYDQSKTVNLQMSTGGYGDAYMKELIGHFEALHADKGWKINLLDPISDFGTSNARDQMYQGADATGWDLVFPGSVFVWDVVNDTMGVAVENISDLYDEVPVGFDGEEESITLKDKVDLPEHFRWAIANGENYDNYYGFAMTGSMRGVGVNTAVLAKYGYTYGNDTTTPMYTTAQFLDVVHGIYEASNGEMAPMIYGGDNAATYSVSGYTVQYAQNRGHDEYLRRDLNWMLDEYEGAIPSDGYRFFTEDPSRQVTMEYMAATWDFLAAYTGSGGLQHTDAHYKLAKGDAAFMFDGNYLYNEITAVGATTTDMRFMHVPTSSYVGIRNDLCGAGHDRSNNMGTHFSGRVFDNKGQDFCEECDEILALICKLTDEGKTESQILEIVNQDYTVSEEQIADVVWCRKVYYGGFTSGGYIMKNCGVEHIAKEFLRMLASDDAAQLYAKYGMVSAFKGNKEVEIPNESDAMLKDVFDLMKNTGFMVYCHSEPGTVAGNMNVTEWGKTYSATLGVTINADPSMTITDGMVLQDRDYTSIAIQLVAKADKDLTNNWMTNLLAAGYKVADSGYAG